MDVVAPQFRVSFATFTGVTSFSALRARAHIPELKFIIHHSSFEWGYAILKLIRARDSGARRCDWRRSVHDCTAHGELHTALFRVFLIILWLISHAKMEKANIQNGKG